MKKNKVVLLNDYFDYARRLDCVQGLSRSTELVIYTDKSGSEDELVERLRDADYIITIRDRVIFTRQLLSRIGHIKLISVCGARLSHMDIEAATEYGIRICAPSLAEQGSAVKAYTAEQTWNLILGLAKDTVKNALVMDNGGWQTRPNQGLFKKTLGIIGLGAVGGRVAMIARAMQMRVIAWSPHLTRDGAEKFGAECVPFQNIFMDSDIVSLHAPLTPDTRDMINDAELKLMKPHALLINTARADLISEPALQRALDDGTIAGVGLDVYWEEPLPRDHWLRQRKNVLLQPHLGGFTEDGFAGLLIPAVENLMAFVNGKPKNLVNG